MILLAAFLTWLIVLTYPIWAMAMYRALKANNKAKFYKFSIVLIILILIPGFYWKVLPGTSLFWGPIERVQDRSYNQELTGLDFEYGEKVYQSETERSFHGDGYSIWIYKLDPNAAEYFKNPNSTFYTHHPDTEFRQEWRSEYWKKTPLKEKDKMFFQFAESSLSELDFELIDVLVEEGNYYAYEYKMHSYGIGNIDFFIICPERRLMVKINHNT